MKADRLWGKKEMDFKKLINFREEAPRYMRQGNLSSTPIQGQRVPGLSYGKGLFQKAAGQNFLTRIVLNVWEKERAKQNKQRQRKGTIKQFLFRCCFNALDKPQEECCGINICPPGT